LSGYRKLADKRARASCSRVVESLDQYAVELQRLAAQVKQARLALEGVAVCPMGDLKSSVAWRRAPAGAAA
jgi:hypothetical protein